MSKEFSYKDRYLFCLARRWRELNVLDMAAEQLRDLVNACEALLATLLCLLILAAAGPPVLFWRLAVQPFWRAHKNKDRINMLLESQQKIAAAEKAAERMVRELLMLPDKDEQVRRLQDLRDNDPVLWTLVRQGISDPGKAAGK